MQRRRGVLAEFTDHRRGVGHLRNTPRATDIAVLGPRTTGRTLDTVQNEPARQVDPIGNRQLDAPLI